MLLLKPPNYVTSYLYFNLCTDSKLMNELITSYSFLHTRFSQPLHNLISLQPPRCTRTSFVVTLSRPPASSSLNITNRPFRHASPHLWNKLPVSLRHPCLNQSSSPLSSPLSSSIILSLFHSKLKSLSFPKIFSSIDTHTHQPNWLYGILVVFVFLLLNGFFFSSHFINFLVYSVMR